MISAPVIRVIGMLTAASSLTLLPPALVGMYFGDGSAQLFLEGALVLLVGGGLIYWPVRAAHRELRLRDGFIIVVASWLTLALGGCLPFLLLREPSLSFIDAFFESMSGLTTTGATILTGIDELPHGILFYRQQLQWLGGMGIIVLAVAILPMLRIGGMQMFRAEFPGPQKDAKLTPRITETAKALWLIYLGLTITCALAYWLGGMSLFDAVGHAFSTVAIGGFSTHDASFAWFDNPTLELIAIFFMVVCGINFALHFVAWRKASAQAYFQDTELKVYIALLLIFAALTTFALAVGGVYPGLNEAARFGAFQTVSALTTSGFTTANFSAWGGMAPALLMSLAFIGGCAGSTAGGMKVIRIILLYRTSVREIRRLIHPHAELPVKFGGQRASATVLDAVMGFFFLFVATTVSATLLLIATGLDLVTAASSAASCITNLGPALGGASANYASLPDAAKLLLSGVMLAGRLEIYTLVVLLSTSFWRD